MKIYALLACFLLTCFWISAGDEPAWTRFGGPNGNYQLSARDLAESWPEAGPKELWSRELGPGYGSILFENGTLYTGYRKGEKDVITALNAADGVTIWEYSYDAPTLEGQNTNFGKGPNSTPLIKGDYLYTMAFNSRVQCLDKKTGKQVWTHHLVKEYGAVSPMFGFSASPIAYRDMVIFLGGGEQIGAIGFDAKTGEKRWASEAIKTSYATPIVVDLEGEDHLIFMTEKGVCGASLKSGKIQWREALENRYGTQAAMPLYGGDGLLFISTQVDSGTKTLSLKREGDAVKTELVSSSLDFGTFHNTPIRDGDVIYGSYKKQLTAYDLKKGEILWKERGYPKINMLKAGDTYIMLDELGHLMLAELSKEGMKVHAKARPLQKPAWVLPTLIGTTLYIRDDHHIKALSLGK